VTPARDATLTGVTSSPTTPDAATPAYRRLSVEERRAQLLRAAQDLFGHHRPEEVSIDDVAAAAGVSRPLVYRYFPQGRPDLFVAVAEGLVAELHERLRHAAAAPFSSAKRMEHLLAALFAFFTENPAAYRVLFHEVWAARDEAVAAAVTAARAPLTSEIADIVATGGGSADEVLLVSTGILGCALANVELALAGAVDAETSWRVTCAFAATQLEG
jgi:AcrR family transcriptional regulator